MGSEMGVRCKDYLMTREGLYFAVVSDRREPMTDDCDKPRYMCQLRYVPSDAGMRKVNSAEANEYLAEHHPNYLCHSHLFDVPIHALRPSDVVIHLNPYDSLRSISDRPDELQAKALRFSAWLSEQGVPAETHGITGSLMLSLHREQSDIDFVIRGLDEFQRAREVVQRMLQHPEFQLSESMWRDTWQRRSSSLDFETYLFHERRKANKLKFEGTRIDLSCLPRETDDHTVAYPVEKQGEFTLMAAVTDDRNAFSLPAFYRIRHEEVQEVMALTATYVGQARTGEWIRAQGKLEVDRRGVKRLVVGTSREGLGEYIRLENPENGSPR